MTSLAAVTDLLDLRPVRDVEDRRQGSTPGRPRLGVVAGRSGPRFLVPTSFPDATAQACLAYLGLRSLRTRLTRGAVGWAIKAHAGRLVVHQHLEADAGPGSLLHLLDELLRDPEHEPGLAVGVGLGPVDEVWKPTLQLFRPDGTPAAFAKVGLGPVASHLVATEAETLAAWGRHPDPRLVVPELLADTTWNGIRVAVVAPLPLDVHRLPSGRPSAWAVRELDGPPQRRPVTDAPWWTDRRAASADDPRIDSLLDRIEARHQHATNRSTTPTWARWHGDWVPWNLARCHRGLAAWDWEYSEAAAPVGLDEVHGAYQQAHVAEGRSIAASLEVARCAARSLAASGSSPTSAAALRAQTATASPPTPFPSARWLADAHLAMLVTRSANLERWSGVPPADQPELLTAALAALRASDRADR